jgi:hypothetical protein
MLLRDSTHLHHSISPYHHYNLVALLSLLSSVVDLWNLVYLQMIPVSTTYTDPSLEVCRSNLRVLILTVAAHSLEARWSLHDSLVHSACAALDPRSDSPFSRIKTDVVQNLLPVRDCRTRWHDVWIAWRMFWRVSDLRSCIDKGWIQDS